MVFSPISYKMAQRERERAKKNEEKRDKKYHSNLTTLNQTITKKWFNISYVLTKTEPDNQLTRVILRSYLD